ncbi:unnamed protein product, partial [Coregonus sp. 'balchen']
MATHKGHAQKGKAKGTITTSGKPYMEDFNESFNNENLAVVEAEALRGRKHLSEPDYDDIDMTKGGMMTMLDRFGEYVPAPAEDVSAQEGLPEPETEDSQVAAGAVHP